MGYFNFYFLKKLINNKHFKKFLFYIAVIYFFFFVWTNVVNANYDFTYNNTNYSIPDIPPSGLAYRIVNFTGSSPYYYLYVTYSSSPLECIYTASNNYSVGLSSGQPACTITQYYYNFYRQKWITEYSNEVITTPFNIGSQFQKSTLNAFQSTFIEADYNIYYNNDLVAGPPENYDVTPYFLNSDEDIAIGNEDLIIMPR